MGEKKLLNLYWLFIKYDISTTTVWKNLIQSYHFAHFIYSFDCSVFLLINFTPNLKLVMHIRVSLLNHCLVPLRAAYTTRTSVRTLVSHEGLQRLFLSGN